MLTHLYGINASRDQDDDDARFPVSDDQYQKTLKILMSLRASLPKDMKRGAQSPMVIHQLVKWCMGSYATSTATYDGNVGNDLIAVLWHNLLGLRYVNTFT